MEENIKKSPKRIVIIVFIIVLLMIIASLCVWYFLFRDGGMETEQLVDNPTDEVIEDTDAPVINGIQDREITVGDDIDIMEGIVAVDYIDGVVETTIEGEVDTKTAGEYTITVKATDNSGNTAEQSFKVTVKEKVEDETAKDKETEDKETKNKNNAQTSQKKTTTTDKSSQNNTNTQTPNNESTTTSKPKLTGIDKEEVLTNTETKYGVVINTYTTTIYNVYSDESRTVKSTNTSKKYDRSNFSAKTSDLIAEAKSVRSANASIINRVLENVNTYRQEANTNAVNGVTDRANLTIDEQLCVAANVRALEMAYVNECSHTRPDGRSCFTVADDMGISAWAENIASGYGNADSVSQGWKDSPKHYSSMINAGYTKIGIGVFKLDRGYYWVQLFA